MFIRKEKDGTIYLAVFNYTENTRSFTLPLTRIGINSVQNITELWSHRNISRNESISIPAKDALSQNITNMTFLPSLVRSEHRKKVRRYYTK